MGYSFGETPSGSWLPSFASTEHIRIADFDGNGLQDILYVVGQERPGGPNDYEVDLNYYFSKGNNEFVFKEELVGYNGNDGGDPTEIDDILRKFTPVYMDADNAADICGEVAHPDFIPINPDPLHIFYTDVGGKEDLLSKVANGFNQTTEFTYESTSAGGDFYTRGSNSSYALNDLQIPLVAVSSVSMSDGIDGQNITNYTYEAGRLHRIGRGFLGFTKVSTENNVSGYTSTSEYEFDTGIGDINNPRKRRYTTALKEQKVMLTSDGSLISEVKNTNEFIDQTNGDEDRYWVRVMKSESTDHINDITTTTDYTYDTDGNVTEEFIDIGGIETVETKNMDFMKSDCSPYNNLARRTEITKTQLSESPHQNIITRTFSRIRGVLSTEKIYALEDKTVDRSFFYDIYGNLNRKTVITPNEIGRVWDYKYDTKGRFPVESENPLNQIETRDYHPLWGKPTRITTVDNLTSYLNYDGFGRVTRTVTPEGYEMLNGWGWSIGSGDGTSNTLADNSIYFTSQRPPHSTDVLTWFDQFARERKVRTLSLGLAGVEVITTYDARGNIKTTTTPFFDGDTPVFTEFEYDEYNRPLKETYDGTNITNYSYNTVNSETTVTTDIQPTNQTMSKTTDAAGKVIKSTDHGGALEFEYNSYGNQTKVSYTDLGSTPTTVEVSSMEYDIYGRQTKLIDKNAGTTTYEYNGYGELISQTDANGNGNVSSFEYDLLGRIEKQTIEEGEITYDSM